MRHIFTLPASLLLACGPQAPPATDTTDSTIGGATDAPTSTTTVPTTTPDVTATTDPSPPTEPTTIDNGSSTSGFSCGSDFLALNECSDVGASMIECDLFAQDCPLGQKCAPWAQGGGAAWNATKCVDITGDQAPGEPCTAPGGGTTGVDDCALGGFCWEVDQDAHGHCVALCTGSPDAPICPPKLHCFITNDGVLDLCLPTCDPVIQDCPGDDLCIPEDDTFACMLDGSGDAGLLNDPCEFANACDKGLLCLNTGSASAACLQGSQGCCQPFCEFPGAPCPNPDQECLQWFDPMMEIPAGLEHVGVCGIPE